MSIPDFDPFCRRLVRSNVGSEKQNVQAYEAELTVAAECLGARKLKSCQYKSATKCSNIDACLIMFTCDSCEW